MIIRTSPTLTRQINAERRALRKLKRTAPPDQVERCRIALKSLTELEGDPLRPGLGVHVRRNIERARA